MLNYLAGVMVAQQTISRPPLLVAQMTEEWLNYYRKIAQVFFFSFSWRFGCREGSVADPDPDTYIMNLQLRSRYVIIIKDHFLRKKMSLKNLKFSTISKIFRPKMNFSFWIKYISTFRAIIQRKFHDQF